MKGNDIITCGHLQEITCLSNQSTRLDSSHAWNPITKIIPISLSSISIKCKSHSVSCSVVVCISKGKFSFRSISYHLNIHVDPNQPQTNIYDTYITRTFEQPRSRHGKIQNATTLLFKAKSLLQFTIVQRLKIGMTKKKKTQIKMGLRVAWTRTSSRGCVIYEPPLFGGFGRFRITV